MASEVLANPIAFERVGDGKRMDARLTDALNDRNGLFHGSVSVAAPAAPPGDELSSTGYIYLDGSIGRPGTYALPQVGSLTLKRFFAAAGVPTDKDFEIIVSRLVDSKPTTQALTMRELRTNSDLDLPLIANDRVVLNSIKSNVPPTTTEPDGSATASEALPTPLFRSPFRGVKWADWTPFVDVQGRWYELLTVDGIPVSVVLDHLRQAHAGEERLWFSERLTDVLTALGRNVGDAVKLEVRDPATGTRLSIDQAAFTKENHERVQAVNKAATDNGEDFPMFVQN
jgi:hypothetical protein